MMNAKTVFSTLGLMILVTLVAYSLNQKSPPEISDVYEDEKPIPFKPRKNLRKPSSITEAIKPQLKSSFREVEKNDSVFKEHSFPTDIEPETKTNYQTTTWQNSDNPRDDNNSYPNRYSQRQVLDTYKPKKDSSKTSGLEGQVFIGVEPKAKSNAPVANDIKTNNTGNSNYVPLPTKTADSFTCSSSVTGGSFSYPLDINLSCSSTATIQYCISENVCCDPSGGTPYTTAIHVGNSASTYCLSYIGTSLDGEVHNSENFFIFNPVIPDLQVNHPKKYLQTTELTNLFSFASENFGTNGFSAGVINMKSHDPSPSDLNLSCEQIANDNHSSLLPDVPSEILANTDTSILSNSSQVDVDLATDNLSYGMNYITTYMRNAQFLDPLYACSTTQVTLEDFEFFDYVPSERSLAAGVNNGELSGGFTHLGFFEPTSSIITRGPAGFDVTTVASEELRFGLFGVFY